MSEQYIPPEHKTTALQCLRARLRLLLPDINTVGHDWLQTELYSVPERYRGDLNTYMWSYVQTHYAAHNYDPAFLNMDMIWQAIIAGRTNLVNTKPDIIAPMTVGDGQWVSTIMSWITLPAAGLLVMAETLADLETLLG